MGRKADPEKGRLLFFRRPGVSFERFQVDEMGNRPAGPAGWV